MQKIRVETAENTGIAEEKGGITLKKIIKKLFASLCELCGEIFQF